MQTYSELASSLQCSDCNTNFNSASLLLQHFAQHICQEGQKHGSNHPSKKMAVPGLQKKKKKPHTILENVLKSKSVLHHVTSTSQCDPGPSTSNMENGTSSKSCRSSSLLSFQTSSPECSQPEICDEAPNSEKRESYYDVGCSKSNDVSLLKCDFQKRLENCITKLATKRESNPKCSVSTEDNTTSIKINGARHKKIKTFRSEILEKTESEDNFSMEFCVDSLDEGDDNGNIDLISNVRPEKESQVKDCNVKIPRNSSSRKQKTPKKVQYVENGENSVSVSSTMLKRKYPCHLCSKVFGWSTDLKRHILTHTGERPFKCKLCEATFTRNFLLQKHQNKVHKSQFGKPIKSTAHNSHLPVKQDRASDVEEAECSDDGSEQKSTRAKGNSSVQVQLGYSEDIKWNEINLMEKADGDVQYNRTPYEIISHEAFNIL